MDSLPATGAGGAAGVGTGAVLVAVEPHISSRLEVEGFTFAVFSRGFPSNLADVRFNFGPCDEVLHCKPGRVEFENEPLTD